MKGTREWLSNWRKLKLCNRGCWINVFSIEEPSFESGDLNGSIQRITAAGYDST